MTSWLHPPKIQWPVIRKSSVVPKSWEIVFSAPPLEIGRVKRTITEWSHQQFSLDQHREPYGSIVKAQLVVLHSQDQITLQLRNSTSRTLRSSLIDSLRDGLPNLTSNCNSSTMMVTVTEVTRWNGTKKCTWKVTGSNRNEVKFSSLLVVVVLWSSSDWAEAQSLCEPNPCGNNTYCVTQSVKVISCRCLPGYTQKEDTFEGCILVGTPKLATAVDVDYSDDGVESNVVKKAIPAKDVEEILQAQEVPETTTAPESRFGSKVNRPQLLEGRGEEPDRESPLVIGFDGSGKAVAGSELAQSNQVRGSIVRESSVNLSNIESSIETEPKLGPVGINRPEFVRNPFKRPWEGKPPQTQEELNAYFPEECLVNEDCLRHEYCNQKVFRCEDPCNLNVCGRGSECKVQLNRPVCYCPVGYEGNPYTECTKTPSRVGLRFRRSIFVRN